MPSENHHSLTPEGRGERAIALSLQNVSVAFDGTPVIGDITLDVHEHQLTCIIGPSGCGKSSLLRSINRLNDLNPRAHTTGQISLYGQSIFDVPEVMIRRRIGMVFQRPNPFPKSIYQNIALGLRVNGFQGDIDAQVERSLNQVGLWNEVKDKLRQSALNLSLGQQQRLCIARAIALGSEVVLMDEPCASLDPISSERINALLNDMKQHYTLIVVTHNLKQAATIADWVAFINVGYRDDSRRGYLAEYGPVPDFFVQPQQPETQNYLYYENASL
ncbi:MAG: phosphate ABC transporter ATP-binding protein [Leptolyngbyaceae bacterium]|nr:phosphate ABC transporter ATP-binding protein [Leptolyngbyaceae bacterium]